MRIASVLALMIALFAGRHARAADSPLRSPIQAVARLRGPDLAAAVKAVDAACRGRTRRTFVDAPPLVAELKRLVGSASPERFRAGLDLYKCVSEARFVDQVLKPELSGTDPARAAYAAEVSARLGSVRAVPLLLDALEARADACAKPDLVSAEVERCVWLVYAPGASLAEAPPELRARAGEAAAAATRWPYPKAREVAVETLAATEQKRFAAPIRALVRAERSGALEPANDPALLKRFAERARRLERSGS